MLRGRRASDIRPIAIDAAAGVDQQKLCIGHTRAGFVLVMQHGSIGVEPDNIGIGRFVFEQAACLQERVVNFKLATAAEKTFSRRRMPDQSLLIGKAQLVYLIFGFYRAGKI